MLFLRHYIFCRRIYVFYLSLDLKRPLHWDVMHMYGWKLFVACHHLEKFGDHTHSDSSEAKCFIKNMNLIKYVLSLKNRVDWIATRREKCHNLENVNFEKKCSKIKKQILHLYDFTLKIETSWGKKVVQPIFWNLKCRRRYCVCLVYLFSDKKNQKYAV